MLPLHAALHTYPTAPPPPPLPSPPACAMNLPLFLWWDNLSTQAYLKGVADLFILNTNAFFWVIFRAQVGVWDKIPARWIILRQAGCLIFLAHI